MYTKIDRIEGRGGKNEPCRFTFLELKIVDSSKEVRYKVEFNIFNWALDCFDLLSYQVLSFSES